MIIFYNKNTGDIYGMIEGRVHSEEEINSASLAISGLDQKDIGKYVVTFLPVYSGRGKSKEFAGMVASEFADQIRQFERDSSILYQKRVVLDAKGNVASFKDKGDTKA